MGIFLTTFAIDMKANLFADFGLHVGIAIKIYMVLTSRFDSDLHLISSSWSYGTCICKGVV